MNLQTFAWLYDSWLGQMARETAWLFPAAETVHFIALCFFLGSMLVIDLRLLGFARSISIPAALRLVPVALAAFVFILMSGIVFVSSDPMNYISNWGFLTKMGLILVGGINALWFTLREQRHLLSLPEGGETAISTKVVAGLSLSCWIAVIAFGRLLPYLSFSVG